MISSFYVRKLNELVTNGKVDISLIDDAVKRILGVKYDLGLFDDPYKYCNEEREKEIIGSKENQEAVLDVARKSIVLLKNKNQLLPLKKKNQTIALIGQLANDKNSAIGNWRWRRCKNQNFTNY